CGKHFFQQGRMDAKAGISRWNRRKGSGVVFGEDVFYVVDRCPKTTPDPFLRNQCGKHFLQRGRMDAKAARCKNSKLSRTTPSDA
ncbi:MAG: hypothetical protein EA424_14460, partial [Planctomycetaceae bacterium]